MSCRGIAVGGGSKRGRVISVRGGSISTGGNQQLRDSEGKYSLQYAVVLLRAPGEADFADMRSRGKVRAERRLRKK